MNLPFLQPLAPYILSILRILASLSFFTHGTQKLLSWPLEGPPQLGGLFLVGGILELVGGLLLAVGLFSRPVAFILSGMMAVAYFMFHNSSFFPIINGGEAAMLFSWVFLYIAAAGPGPWSLDAILNKG